MIRFFVIALIITILSFNIPEAKAQVVGSESYTVQIPTAIRVEGVGISQKNQSHGIPSETSTNFSMLVQESYDGKYWELTTENPIGLSLSYNSGGSIIAVFVSMQRLNDGFILPQENISIYPSKAIFDTGPKGGDYERIFHFNPIIKVSKDSPPGVYVANITFTIIGQ